MVKKILELAEFFIERPAVTGAMVWGALYLMKRTKGPRKPLSSTEKAHALELYQKQRTYADTMYDPPDEGPSGLK